MDANLSISSNSAPSGSAGNAAPGALGAGAELRGADFADLLRGLQSGAERQDLAASGLAEAGLQAVALSPQLELITAASPVPDADSLMAFARSQGLDDGTLALLFGVPASVSPATLSLGAAGQGAASLLTGAAVPAAWALGASGLTPGQVLGLNGEAGAQTAGQMNALLNAQTVAQTAAQGDALGVSDLAWQVGKPAATSVIGTTAPTDAPENLAEALRLQLQMPAEAVAALTRRLAGLSGKGQTLAWGQLQAQALADTPENTLDLSEFFSGGGALAEAAFDAATPPAGSTPALEAGRSAASSLTLHGPQGESAAPTSQAAARVEHYQQLADRLGQALAQRLQAQIERGEWKLQMRMNPASLGRVDLELDMRASGLDAVFRSDNPLTRELIAQGLPKLRDSLSQSGMAVANVWVNGDSAGQAGGNPTPMPSPAKALTSDRSDSALETPPLPTTSARRTLDGQWDVLA